MNDFIVILMAVLAVLMIALIALYNRFDRMRFRMERLLYGVRGPMSDWVKVCAELRGGNDEGWSSCKKLADKTECIRTLVTGTPENSEEKLDLQESLLEFCVRFNFMAEKFDQALNAPFFGRIAQKLGFRPVGRIDFYPDIKP